MRDNSDRILELRWHAQDGLADLLNGVGAIDGVRGGDDGGILSPDSDAKIRTSRSTSAAIMSCVAERCENMGSVSMELISVKYNTNTRYETGYSRIETFRSLGERRSRLILVCRSMSTTMGAVVVCFKEISEKLACNHLSDETKNER